MTNVEGLACRTEQKLRFAQIALNELHGHPSRHTGDDFERSHHEAFLFHFYGAIDAFLQELNLLYDCGLKLDEVSRRSLKDRLSSVGKHCPELDEISQLEATGESFLALAKAMRHYATHRGGLPMAHYFNGPSNIVHPVTREEFKLDSLDLLGGWLQELTALLGRLRASAAMCNAS